MITDIDLKIYATEDNLEYSLFLDRDWFKEGDIIYLFGKTPVTIGRRLFTMGFNTYYQIKENYVVKADDWFTLEKQEEEKKPTITIEIKITYQ